MGEKGDLSPNLLSPSRKSIASPVGGTRNGLQMFIFEGVFLCVETETPSVELKTGFYMGVPKGAHTQEHFLFYDRCVVQCLSVMLWDAFLSPLSQRLRKSTLLEFRFKNYILIAKKERVSFTNIWEDEINIIFILILKTIQMLA